MRTCDEYKTLCKDEFNLIEVQERRLAFKSPTKKLIPDHRCIVVPPLWKYPSKRIRLTNCRSKPPLVVNLEPGPEYEDLALKCCLICGYFVKPNIVVNGTQRLIHYNDGECQSCKRKVHKKCIAGVFLKTKSFRCCLVKYHLGECGNNIQGPNGPLDATTPGRVCDLCLICGGRSEADRDVVKCKHNCNFGVHRECLSILGEINNVSYSSVDFECVNVTYQLKESEINKYRNCSGSCRRELQRSIKARGKVGSGKYARKRKRWLNDEITCEYCGKLYGTDEKNHLEVFCSGMYGDGLTEDNRAYPFSRLKRFRHLTRKTP